MVLFRIPDLFDGFWNTILIEPGLGEGRIELDESIGHFVRA